MSVIDVLNRVEAICKKHDKYDVEKRDVDNVSGDDSFDRLLEKSEAAAAREKNCAEIRPTKERLMEKVPELQKLELKKKGFNQYRIGALLEQNKLEVGQLRLLTWKLSLIPLQMQDLRVSIFSRLKNRINLDGSMGWAK